MGQEWCGKWMPRKKTTTCARAPGHGGPCKTAETMERNRLSNRDHPHRESPESRKKSSRRYRISSYGLTQELFDLLLEAQQHACGMCHEPFSEGSSSTWIMIARAAGARTDRAESAYGDSCAIPAISRWATSNADMRWLALTWTALPPGSTVRASAGEPLPRRPPVAAAAIQQVPPPSTAMPMSARGVCSRPVWPSRQAASNSGV